MITAIIALFPLLLILLLVLGFRLGGVRKAPHPTTIDQPKRRRWQRRRKDEGAGAEIAVGSEPWRGRTAQKEDESPSISAGGGRFGGGGATGDWRDGGRGSDGDDGDGGGD